MVIQSSVSGGEKGRGLFRRPETVAAVGLVGREEPRFQRSVGCGGGPWMQVVSRVLVVAHGRIPVNCAPPREGASSLCLHSVLGISDDCNSVETFQQCSVIHRCPTRGSVSLSDEELGHCPFNCGNAE